MDFRILSLSTKDSAPELSETRLPKLNSTKRPMKRLLFVFDFRVDETLLDVMAGFLCIE
jgi:hypothetical protein